jgi:hypothetical protein
MIEASIIEILRGIAATPLGGIVAGLALALILGLILWLRLKKELGQLAIDQSLNGFAQQMLGEIKALREREQANSILIDHLREDLETARALAREQMAQLILLRVQIRRLREDVQAAQAGKLPLSALTIPNIDEVSHGTPVAD